MKDMECEFCKRNKLGEYNVLNCGDNNSETCRVVNWIDATEGSIVTSVTVFGGEVFYEEAPPEIKINYCPMCGRKMR